MELIKLEKIPMYIESERGHDTADVPQDKVQEKVEEQLKDDKLVTLEKESGETEILTQSDMPTEEKQQENKDWAEKFEKTKSATATHKSKGG